MSSSATPASPSKGTGASASAMFGNVLNFGRDAMAQLAGRATPGGGGGGSGSKGQSTYDQASENILEKINQDMEVALSAKDITKRDTLVLKSLTAHYRTAINRRDDYLNLAGFCGFGVLYLAVLVLQRTSNEAFGVTSVLETLVPPTKIMSTREEVFGWLEKTVTSVWTDPDCGDGVCEAPVEFPGYDRFGCKADCGSVLDAYKNISGLHVDLYYDFTNQAGALSSVEGLSTVSWNLCPRPGTAAGQKGMGGVPHGTACFYAEDQRLTAVRGKDHIVLPEVADGEWELRITGDLLWKVAAAVRYHSTAVPETIQGKALLAGQAALSAINAEKTRLETALGELAKAGDTGVILIEYIKRLGSTAMAKIDVLEKTNAYSPAFAAAQKKLITDAEALNVTAAQQGVANCVNRFVSDFCGAHYNKTDVAQAQHYALQRDAVKKIAGLAQVDALTALVTFQTALHAKFPELSDELDHMVEAPHKYVLAGATEEDQRKVRASIETLMELEVLRIQAGVNTKLTPAVVDSTVDSGLSNLITLRRNEIVAILAATPARGLDAFTELSALGRFGGGSGAYKVCNLAGRGAGGYTGKCAAAASSGDYDVVRCAEVCQCGALSAVTTTLTPSSCNSTAGEMCVCDKCQGTMAMGGVAGAAAATAAAAGRRHLLQAAAATPSAAEQTVAQLTALQSSTAALEASLAQVKAAQAASIAAERAHHESTALADSITAGFASMKTSVDSLQTIIRGVAPSAVKATERAVQIESRVARLASLGTDRLALLKDALSANLANIEVSYAAGYASAASRDAMVRKTNLKAMSDEMQTYLSSKPCAAVSRTLPLRLTSGGRDAAADGAAQRVRTVGLTNRVIGGLLVYVKRAGREVCDTRFKSLQSSCLDLTVDDTAPFGVDPAFKRGSSFYSPDFDDAAAARLYNCSKAFGAAATFDAAGTGTGNAPPFCKELFDDSRIPFGFFRADTKRYSNGYPVFFDINLSEDNAVRWLNYLREAFMLDERTKEVSVQLVTYNAEIRYFGSMSVNFGFKEAGSIEITKDVAAVRVEIYSEYTDIIRGFFEGLLTLAVVASFIFEMSDLIRAKRTAGTYLAYFESGWNYIDLASIGITLSAICYWWTFVNVIIADLNVEPRYDVYQDLEAPAKLLELAGGGAGLLRAVDEIGDVAAAARYLSFYMTLMSINIVLYVARILKFMNFQPRIGLVTRTLAVAASDLIHFFILAIVVFVGYAIMGHLLFGAQIQAFSTMADAMQTNFEMLLGEVTVSNQMLALVGPSIEFASVMYFWTYQILVYMILLNFLLAIIVDAFGEVKATLGNEKSMYEEVAHIAHEKYLAFGASFLARGSKEYVTEDVVEAQLRKWGKASKAIEDEEAESEEEEKEEEKVFKLGEESVSKEELEEIIARAVNYSQGKFNLWKVKGETDGDETTMRNPDLEQTGRGMGAALKRQKRPLPTAADITEAAAMVMQSCGEVQVDPLYDDEVTKQELSKALNDVAAGQNRLAQMHQTVIELLDRRSGRSGAGLGGGPSGGGGGVARRNKSTSGSVAEYSGKL